MGIGDWGIGVRGNCVLRPPECGKKRNAKLRYQQLTNWIGLARSLLAYACMAIQSYRDLEAWKVGMDFAVRIYAVTKQFPRTELYGLTSQLRRASVAVPSNVAEGHRQGTKAYSHFVTMALGSLAEAETQIELARRLSFLTYEDAKEVAELSATLGRILHGLRRALTPNPQSPIPNP